MADALTAAKEAMVSGLSPEDLISIVTSASKRKRGRKAPDHPQFTFPDSGYTVRVRKIGPWTLDQIRLSLRRVRREPPVPIIDVEDGEYPDGRPRYRKEANPADPDFKIARQEYENWLAETAGYRILDLIVSSCVIPDKDDIDQEEIAFQRSILIRTGPLEDPEKEEHAKKVGAMSDEEIFVRCICLQSNRDMTALQGFVLSRGTPTPELIDEQVSAFQPEIQGDPDL